MKKIIIFLIFIFLSNIEAFTKAPLVVRRTQKTPLGNVIVDMVFYDADDDGCYDHIDVYYDGDYDHTVGPFLVHNPNQSTTSNDSYIINANYIIMSEIQINDSIIKKKIEFYNSDSIKTATYNPTLNGGIVVNSSHSSYKKSDLFENNNQVNTNDIIIYPNPVINELNLDFNKSKLKVNKIKLYDFNGRLVKFLENGQNNLSDIQSGVYYLNIYTDDNEYITKFIKE